VGGTWTAYIIVVRVPFLKKVIRSKLCVEGCAWNGFRTRSFMAVEIMLVEFSAFFCDVTQMYGVPAPFVEGDMLHEYYKCIIQGEQNVFVASIPTVSQSDTILATRVFVVVTRTPEAFELHLLSRNGVPIFFSFYSKSTRCVCAGYW
jgi:hypothetical protein